MDADVAGKVLAAYREIRAHQQVVETVLAIMLARSGKAPEYASILEASGSVVADLMLFESATDAEREALGAATQHMRQLLLLVAKLPPDEIS